MNIFENYLEKFNNLVLSNLDKLNLEKSINFDGVVIEIPPQEFNYDLSTNIALVLAKKSKQKPVKFAADFIELLKNNIDDFSELNVAGPGFINLKFSKPSYQKIIKNIIDSKNQYGSNKKKSEKYNIEFVSANPTGPMHIGHSRGAVFGDTLANLLIFNGNIVTKEYYINDYGNQIINFAESVFYRLREIKFNETFINKENLYPGEYIIDIAKKILIDYPNIDLSNFKENFELLKKESLKHSMNLIKDDLKALGITHNNFISETNLVERDLVKKSVDLLVKKIMSKKDI